MPKWKLVYDGKPTKKKFDKQEEAEAAKAKIQADFDARGIDIKVDVREVQK